VRRRPETGWGGGEGGGGGGVRKNFELILHTAYKALILTLLPSYFTYNINTKCCFFIADEVIELIIVFVTIR
jgi:hypothetical protein